MSLSIQQITRCRELSHKGFSVNEISHVLNLPRPDVRVLLKGHLNPSRHKGVAEQLEELLSDIPEGRTEIEHRRIVTANFPEIAR